MQKGQKILTAVLWAATMLAMISIIGAGFLKRQRDRESAGFEVASSDTAASTQPDILATVPPFALTDENGRPFTRDSLAGHPFIADFIYTRCPGPCPIMTGKMSGLQSTLANPDLNFLSVTIDPEFDKPDVLKKYAEDHAADLSRWHFVTGDKDAVYALAKGMLIAAVPASQGQPIIHSQKFILVDASGNIRGYYNSNEQDDLARLITDARKFAPSPAHSPAHSPAPSPAHSPAPSPAPATRPSVP